MMNFRMKENIINLRNKLYIECLFEAVAEWMSAMLIVALMAFFSFGFKICFIATIVLCLIVFFNTLRDFGATKKLDKRDLKFIDEHLKLSKKFKERLNQKATYLSYKFYFDLQRKIKEIDEEEEMERIAQLKSIGGQNR